MTLKLRLAGGKLSVTIGVANPQTLAAIEDDRALIAARLGAGEQALEDLVIQRQIASRATRRPLRPWLRQRQRRPAPLEDDRESRAPAAIAGRRAASRRALALAALSTISSV